MGNSEEKFWFVILQVSKLVSGLSDESLNGDATRVVDPVLGIMIFILYFIIFLCVFLNFQIFKFNLCYRLRPIIFFLKGMLGRKLSERGLQGYTLLSTEIRSRNSSRRDRSNINLYDSKKQQEVLKGQGQKTTGQEKNKQLLKSKKELRDKYTIIKKGSFRVTSTGDSPPKRQPSVENKLVARPGAEYRFGGLTDPSITSPLTRGNSSLRGK